MRHFTIRFLIRHDDRLFYAFKISTRDHIARVRAPNLPSSIRWRCAALNPGLNALHHGDPNRVIATMSPLRGLPVLNDVTL